MRPLWFLAGAGAGVYAVVRARRVAEALTPEGFADRMDGLRLGLQLFSDEVRTGMTEKETELREKFVIGPDGGLPALGSAPSATETTNQAAIAPTADQTEGERPRGHQ